MTVTLKTQITEDMKTAMRAGDKKRLGTIRLMLAAIKQREIDERIVLTDEHIIALLNKMIKQRRESMLQYEQAKRQDLVDQEMQEILVIQHYLPQQLSAEELELAIDAAIAEAQANSLAHIGKVMTVLKTKFFGRIDMALAHARVKTKLHS